VQIGKDSNGDTPLMLNCHNAIPYLTDDFDVLAVVVCTTFHGGLPIIVRFNISVQISR
jgi:hypothetical protein